MNPNNHEDAIKRHAVREAAIERKEAFTESILDDAGTVVAAEAADSTAILRALTELDHAGYPASDEDEPDAVGFASLSDYQRLLDVESQYRRLPDRDTCEVQTVVFRGSKALPEGTLLVVYPYAVAPTYPADIDKPWTIRDPDGVVRIMVDDV